MEADFQTRGRGNQVFSLAIPRDSCLSQAAARFLCTFDNSRELELVVKETGALQVIESVADRSVVLGILRYPSEDEAYFLKSLTEKGLQYENLWQSYYVALMSRNHPLADTEKLSAEDFLPYIEIAFGDDFARTRAGNPRNTKCILVFDRATQFDLLRSNPLAYTWISPQPQELLTQSGLVQRECQNSCVFKDVLISRTGYHYSELDRGFINELTFRRDKAASSSAG